MRVPLLGPLLFRFAGPPDHSQSSADRLRPKRLIAPILRARGELSTTKSSSLPCTVF
jgi:hypothetical protein